MVSARAHCAPAGIFAARRATPTRSRRSLRLKPAAEGHDQRADPDQRHQRLPVKPRVERSVLVLVGDADIDLAEVQRDDAGLRASPSAAS